MFGHGCKYRRCVPDGPPVVAHAAQSGSGLAGCIAAVCKGVNVGADYIGPVFCTSRGVANLVHPEHGNHEYQGDMTIAVVIQRNFDSESQRERRTLD